MIATFYDRQDLRNPANGTRINSDQQICALFENLKSRSPFFCELVGGNGYNLLVGIGGNIGCAQYGRADGKPPYLMATQPELKSKTGLKTFLTGDTATPIPERYCLDFGIIRNIVLYFLD